MGEAYFVSVQFPKGPKWAYWWSLPQIGSNVHILTGSLNRYEPVNCNSGELGRLYMGMYGGYTPPN